MVDNSGGRGLERWEQSMAMVNLNDWGARNERILPRLREEQQMPLVRYVTRWVQVFQPSETGNTVRNRREVRCGAGWVTGYARMLDTRGALRRTLSTTKIARLLFTGAHTVAFPIN